MWRLHRVPGNVGGHGGGEISKLASLVKAAGLRGRLDQPMEAAEMIAAADRELSGCAHRFVEWMIPMPDSVVGELRERGWMANPLVFLLHDGRPLRQVRGELVEVDYDLVRELRDL